MIRHISRVFSQLATFALALTPILSAAEPSATESAAVVVVDAAVATPAGTAAAAVPETARRVDPMDTTGLDYGVANILRKYYRKNFTNSQTWEQIESIRFDGSLQLPQGEFSFTAFKKKPDYCKVAIFATNGGHIVMSYDGSDAWQLNTIDADSSPTAMPEGEARNFIRDASTGGHLLEPRMPGKIITLEGTPVIDGERAYHLRIQLPDGQVVQSFLHMTTFAEIRQITINNVNGDEEVTTYSDFRQVDGITFPFVSTLTIDGQQIHQSRIERVQTDLGLMPWMFARPSGAHLPGDSNTPRDRGSPYPPASASAADPVTSAEPSAFPPPASASFGSPQPWQTEDIWAPSVFIDPDLLNSEEIQSLSEQADRPLTQ